LIKILSKTGIPENIKIYNFRVESANAKMFANLGKYLGLDKNDGAVDFRDTTLEGIPNYEKLIVKDYIIKGANHIPFPKIKPVFEMHQTMSDYYGFMKILLNGNYSKSEGVFILHGLMSAIMKEFGLDLEYVLKNENYSIIDYFADNPIDF